jgi:hypothetical protein
LICIVNSRKPVTCFADIGQNAFRQKSLQAGSQSAKKIKKSGFEGLGFETPGWNAQVIFDQEHRKQSGRKMGGRKMERWNCGENACHQFLCAGTKLRLPLIRLLNSIFNVNLRGYCAP